MSAVFISYASRDAALAHDLVEGLEAAGVACWISLRDVAPGANYQESIVAAIRGGRAMVVLVSEAANASDTTKCPSDRRATKSQQPCQQLACNSIFLKITVVNIFDK